VSFKELSSILKTTWLAIYQEIDDEEKLNEELFAATLRKFIAVHADEQDRATLLEQIRRPRNRRSSLFKTLSIDCLNSIHKLHG
jgi:hypothetical protein